MKEFKCKYPSDSKEYLFSYLLNRTKDNVDVKSLEKIKSDKKDALKLSFNERCVLVSDLIDYHITGSQADIDILTDYVEELLYLKKINGMINPEKISNKSYDHNCIVKIDEENDKVFVTPTYSDKILAEVNIYEFLKSI